MSSEVLYNQISGFADRLSYKLRTNDVARRSVRSKNTLMFQSDRSSYGASDVIKIELGSSRGYLDALNSHFSLFMKTSDDKMRLKGDISRIVSRLRITNSTGSIIEEIVDVGMLQQLLHCHTVSNIWKSTVAGTQGYDPAELTGSTKANEVYDGASGTAYPASMLAGRQYKLNLTGISGLLSSPKYLPLGVMGNLIIEITLASAETAFKCLTVVAAPTYTVSKVSFVAEVLELSDDINKAILEKSDSGSLIISFPTFFTNSFNLTATAADNSVSNQEIQLRKSCNDLRSIYCVIRETSKVANQLNDSFETIPGNWIDNYQFQIGSTFIPVRPVDNSTDAFCEMEKGFNKHNSVTHDASSFYEYSQGTKHCIAVDFERSPIDVNTGVSTQSGAFVALRLGLRHSTAATVIPATTINCYSHYTRMLIIGSNGNLTINE